MPKSDNLCTIRSSPFSVERLRIESVMPESDATTRPRATKQRTADPVVGALVSLSRSGVAVLDIELRFRHVNEPLSCLLGRPVDHLIGQSLTDIATPIATIAASLCCQAIATGVTQTLTEVQSPNDADGGPVRSWDLRCERVDGDRGVPPVVCLLVDERMPSRSAIEDLRESEHYNRLLIGQFPGVVYTLSLATPGDVLSISPQIEELLGYRPDEIVHVPAISSWCSGRCSGFARADSRYGCSIACSERTARSSGSRIGSFRCGTSTTGPPTGRG